MENIPYALSAGFILIGGILAAVGLTIVRRHIVRLRTWRREQATVVDYEWSGSGDRSRQHWVIERVTASGEAMRTVSQIGTSHGTMRSFPFSVMVLVNPDDETQLVMAGGARSGWAGLFFVIGALLMLTIGVIVGVLFFQAQR